ncbi:hypothetical protein NJ76_22820 [Rhodococcus sp. IITR03]|nr:hypothetical protein NJ76_22820 [Rhodococcus sp. IITR03]
MHALGVRNRDRLLRPNPGHQSGGKPAVCTAAGMSMPGGNEEGSGGFGRLSAKGAARFQPNGNP